MNDEGRLNAAIARDQAELIKKQDPRSTDNAHKRNVPLTNKHGRARGRSILNLTGPIRAPAAQTKLPSPVLEVK